MEDLVKIHEILDSFFSLCHIPICLVTTDGQSLYCNLKKEKVSLPPQQLHEEINNILKWQKYHTVPFMHTTFLDVSIGGFALDDKRLLIAGPVSAVPVSRDSFIRKYKKMLSREDLSFLFRINEQSATADATRFAHLLSLLSRILLKQDSSALTILSECFALKSITPNDEEQRSELVIISVETVIAFQNSITSAISAGNHTALEEIWQNPVPMSYQDDNRSEAKDHRIYIPQFSHMNFAALRGGANHQRSFNLFDYFAEALNSCVTASDCNLLLMQASFAFCDLVRSRDGQTDRPRICTDMEEYINQHICEHLSSKDIAAAFNISERQISRIFQRSFGMPLTSYVNHERLRRAALMLLDSNYSVSDVSDYFGYTSQSYFSKLFQKEYGCSPLAFRKKPDISSAAIF